MVLLLVLGGEPRRGSRRVLGDPPLATGRPRTERDRGARDRGSPQPWRISEVPPFADGSGDGDRPGAHRRAGRPRADRRHRRRPRLDGPARYSGSSISTMRSRRGRTSTRRRSPTPCCGAITHLGDTATILVVGVAISAYGLWRWRKPVDPPLRDDGRPRPGADLEHDQGRDRPRPARASSRARSSPGRPSRAGTRPPRRPPIWRWPWCSGSAARRGPARRSAGPRSRSRWPSAAHGCCSACTGSPTWSPGS